MIRPAKHTRRSFLRVSAKAAIWLLTWLGWGSREARAVPVDSAGHAFLDVIRHPESARVVGREYLRTHAEEADREVLVSRLEAACGAEVRDFAALSRTLRADALRRRIRAEFAAGETVELRGWRLARSEARLCALVLHSAPTDAA